MQLPRLEPKEPWQNGVAECLVGSVKRELPNHLMVRHEQHLWRLLSELWACYHEDRANLGVGKTPSMRRMTSFTSGRCRMAEFSTKPSRVSPLVGSRSSFFISPSPLRGRMDTYASRLVEQHPSTVSTVQANRRVGGSAPPLRLAARRVVLVRRPGALTP